MKCLSRIFTPTGTRRLNELIGFLLIVSAIFLFLALASYSPLDPSFNTAAAPPASRPARNWVGMVGAYTGDLLFQALGVSAFLLPLCLALLGARWFRSRKVSSPGAKAMGAASLLVFVPSLLALLPFTFRWMGAIPMEGLLG